MTLHEDELAVDEAVVRALVDRQFPQFAGRSVDALPTTGSSNALFRLGEDLLVRLPRQPGGSQAIMKEAQWVPHVAPALPVAIPEVVGVGEPDLGYPERWSIVRWIDGDTPDGPTGCEESTGALARDLADVIRNLHDLSIPSVAWADPALRWYRGDPLITMDATTRANIADCHDLPDLDLDLPACLRVWQEAVSLPSSAESIAARWLHGDLLAENLLVRGGRLVAVLDFGGLSIGDPTIDLMVGWELLDPAGRQVLRAALEADEPTWIRGRAWALAIAVMTFPYYWRTMPGRCAARLAMAHAVLDDAGSEKP